MSEETKTEAKEELAHQADDGATDTGQEAVETKNAVEDKYANKSSEDLREIIKNQIGIINKVNNDDKTKRLKINELTEMVKQYDGIDPEKYKALLQAEKEVEQKKLEEAQNYQQIIDNALKEKDAAHQEELAAILAQNQEFKAKVENMAADNRKANLVNSITAAAARNKAINPDQIVTLVQGSVGFGEDGKPYVIDNSQPDGVLRENGVPITMDTYVDRFLNENKHLVQPSNKPGSGSSRPDQSATAPKTYSRSELSSMSIDEYRQHQKDILAQGVQGKILNQ